MGINEGLFASEKMDWATPWDLFNLYDKQFGFTLDVCATAENAKCELFFTVKENGLAQSWDGHCCWMNPPYGAAIVDWVKKAARERENARCIVCLLPARTDTAWWHNYVAPFASMDFLRGRVRFVGAESSAPFPSAIAIYMPGRRSQMVQWRDWKREVVG